MILTAALTLADLFALAYEKPMTALWIAGVVVGAIGWLFKREEPNRFRFTTETDANGGHQHTETRPDNPKFATWHEAFNRPITDPLKFHIEYVDADGVITEREISPRSIHLRRSAPDVVIKAFCHLRNEERSFRSERIQRCRNLQTGRNIGDLGQYLRGKY